MWGGRVPVVAVVALVGSVWAAPTMAADARQLPKPAITGLTASTTTVAALYGTSTVSASVAHASSCRISSTPSLQGGAGAVDCSSGTISQTVSFPANTSRRKIPYRVSIDAVGPGGVRSKSVTIRVEPGAGGVPPSGTRAVVSDNDWTDCAIRSTGGVSCWGLGNAGQLGDGVFHLTGTGGVATPVDVRGVGGIGLLSGVTSLVGVGPGEGVDQSEDTFCALLTSGSVDCWGQEHTTPDPVVGVGGSGVLGGVTSITAGADSVCAVLVSTGVDCWGGGYFGQLGNGYVASAAPVEVLGVGGTGILTGVVSLSSASPGTYCAVLTSGNVACWGAGATGALGDGSFFPAGQQGSDSPSLVVGVGGGGTLSGVTSVEDGFGGSGTVCAVLTTSGVDCWGWGLYGELGNGVFYSTGFRGSAVPVQVEGVDGQGVLTGVRSLSGGGAGTVCAVLTSGGVDCWGMGNDGTLGNGTVSTSVDASATPVPVEGVGGVGSLAGVVSVVSTGPTVCAALSGGGADCWGYGIDGELGDGVFFPTNEGSAVPVEVLGVGGTGLLGGVASLTGATHSVCAGLTSGRAVCWGYGSDGELGNGSSVDSATPVAVTLG